MKLLIVDDQEVNHLLLETLAKKHLPDIEILKANDAAEGLHTASSHQIDCALIDLNMPGMDGIEMCRKLKADKKTCHISVILLTSSSATSEIRVKALEAGADDFIHRPFDNSEFVARLKVQFRIRTAEEKLSQMNSQLEQTVKTKVDELRKNELKYRVIYETAPLPYQSLDENGCIVDVNPAWLQTLGFKLEEVLGHSFGEFIHPDFVPLFNEKFPTFKRLGHVHDVQYQMRHKDGHYIDISLEGCAGYLPDGSFDRTYCVFQDISRRKKTEKELIESQNIFKTITNQSSEGITLTDPAGNYTFVNKTFCRLTGYTETELLQMNFVDIESTSPINTNTNKPVKTSTGLPFQQTLKRQDGTELIAEITNKAVEINNRQSILRIVRDITESVATKNKLSVSEEKFSKAFYSHPVAMQIVNIASGERIDFNESFVQLYGADRAQLAQTNIFKDNFWDDPDQPQKDFELLVKNRVLNNQPMTAQLATGEIKSLLVSRSMLDIGDGNLAISSFLDVSDTKRISDERERLIHAIEQTVEAIVITDLNGDIQFVNPAFTAITGYSDKEVLGENPRFLKSDLHDKAFYQSMWETLQQGEIWNGRITNKRKNGEFYTEEMSISPVLDPTGTITNFVAIKNDITHEIVMETQARQSQKMEAVGILAGGVAHDFNNMLSVILGYTEIALRKTDPTASIFKNLEAIQKAADRSAELTRQLLAFSRQQPLIPQVINLNDLSKNLENMLRRMIGEDINFVSSYQTDLGLVEADPGQIDQIVMNLVVNARDAMPDGGKLTIETANVELDEKSPGQSIVKESGSFVMIAISDTGCGMDAKTQERIFEPFFTTKETGKGTGLGLSTAYGIVKQSKGYIWCYSEPEVGTTFKIYLPRTEAEISPEPESCVIKTLNGSEEHILMVEDEKQVRQMLESMLTSLKYSVTIAENGEEALRLIKTEGLSPDLVITDVVMPGLGGKEMIDKIREIRPDQKVLFMSGYTNDAINHHGILETGIHFLQKPFTLQSVAAKIKETLYQTNDNPDHDNSKKG